MFLCFRPSDRNLERVVKKNFESHEGRNTKTAMMFTVALSFLIFAGSTFQLISNLILTQVESVIGADIYFTSRLSPNFLNEGDIIQFINEQNAVDNAITSYSFGSAELTDIISLVATNGGSK